MSTDAGNGSPIGAAGRSDTPDPPLVTTRVGTERYDQGYATKKHCTARHWFSVRATSGAPSCQFGRTSAGQPTSQVATRRQTRPETTPRFVAARSSKRRTKYRFLRSNVFPAVVRFPCETRSPDPAPCRAHFRPEPSPEMESRGCAVFVMIGLGRGSSVIVPNWRSLH